MPQDAFSCSANIGACCTHYNLAMHILERARLLTHEIPLC